MFIGGARVDSSVLNYCIKSLYDDIVMRCVPLVTLVTIVVQIYMWETHINRDYLIQVWVVTSTKNELNVDI